MKLFDLYKFTLTAVASTIAGTTLANPLAIYGNSINFENSPGCLTIGDAISCSAPLLNVLNGLSSTTLTGDGGYVFQTNQGTLQHDFLVVGGGGNSGNNSGIEPTAPEAEDGFKSNDAGADNYFATGTTGSTSGNLNDPDNNALSGLQDKMGTWDVSISWLIEALTFDDGRHQLLIGFDYNEPQNGSAETLDYWSLISVWDSTGAITGSVDYEIRDFTGLSVNDFTTTKDFDSKPLANDFATVNGISCIDTNGSELIPVLSKEGGSCDPGYETEVKNTLATNLTEIVATLPELDQLLESFLAAGYDTISARVLLGCFDNNATDNKVGQGYLADDGATTSCGEGGFPDIYLMAGDVRVPPPTSVPEPAPIFLIGIGLLLLTRFCKHKTPAL